MRSFQQKTKWRNFLQSKPVLVFLGLLILFFVYGMLGFIGKMEITKENRDIVKNKVAQLKKEKEKLSSDIEKLKTESGIEESIREKFGLAKEGEGLIVVVDDKNMTESPKKDEPISFFSFFKSWFQP